MHVGSTLVINVYGNAIIFTIMNGIFTSMPMKLDYGNYYFFSSLHTKCIVIRNEALLLLIYGSIKCRTECVGINLLIWVNGDSVEFLIRDFFWWGISDVQGKWVKIPNFLRNSVLRINSKFNWNFDEFLENLNLKSPLKFKLQKTVNQFQKNSTTVFLLSKQHFCLKVLPTGYAKT